MSVDWKEVESAWVKAAVDAISSTATKHPREQFYAGAFWLLHGDYSSIRVPAFGLNSRSSADDVRWHPPDWKWSLIDAVHERLEPLYAPLLELDASPEIFENLWEQNIDALAAAARRVTDRTHAGGLPVPDKTFTPHFFVGIIDFAHGDSAEDYLRRSVDSERLRASGILDEL